MLHISLQYFGNRGARGSGGARGGRGGGGSPAKSNDPMDVLEAQVNATEQKIQQLRAQQKSMEDQTLSLVRARNYTQIKLNNRKSENLEKEIASLEKELVNLHKRGRALSRD